ncbi:hypothetical protein PsorP6_004746 [Peronosclerospora sorghi]|uniref:Uncharacterized protein n=1 Tax=Peronosclerospora sorghi TaxID=230839 RepID=A0ACC0VM52_9STRA|nr:hypothetical protein PsorP6_004746 [Peronosclerospora sorghi]
MLIYVTQDFEVMPRRIHIDQIDIQNFTPGYFPEVEIDVICGAGTYIRSIARECGEALVAPPEHLHSLTLCVTLSASIVLEELWLSWRVLEVKPSLSPIALELIKFEI